MCGPVVLKLFPPPGSPSPFFQAQLWPAGVFPDALLQGPSSASCRHPKGPDKTCTPGVERWLSREKYSPCKLITKLDSPHPMVEGEHLIFSCLSAEETEVQEGLVTCPSNLQTENKVTRKLVSSPCLYPPSFHLCAFL